MKPLLLFASALAVAAQTANAQQVGRVPVEVRIETPPTALFALGRPQLVYELHLTNFGTRPLTLVRVDVLDAAGVVLDSLNQPKLAQRLSVLGPPPASGVPITNLQPASHTIADFWIALPQNSKAPSSIQHRLIFAQAAGSPDTVRTPPVAVDGRTLPALASPVSAGTWVAIRGPSNSSGHRLSIVTLNGHAGIPQRYAVDWAMLGPDGRLFHGDSTIASNWYGHGTAVYAVAAGTVVSAHDGTTERAALSVNVPLIIEPADATGNSIVIDLGDGRFATYAHLKPGSITVKAGDRVTEGQAIAAVGNSGNTLGPHLHFHVSTSGELLGGEGLPFVLRNFELVGRAASLVTMLNGTPWVANAAQPARTVQLETPLENMIVRFAARAPEQKR